MKIIALKCPKCKDIIYSRSRHDWRSCTCGAMFVDGGFDYCRVGAEPEIASKLESVEIEVTVTKKELYDDWNNGKDKYGKITTT